MLRAMRIFISADMEGVAGVVHVDQTRRTGHDYERARAWMTREVNAAVAGAYDAGAQAVLVNDSHGDMRNFLLDELDPRVELVSGDLKPLSMVQGVDGGFDAAFFVGYHAGASSRLGVLDHTYYGKVVHAVTVGGRPYNETALNALVAGAHGVPVALVTGDETTCAQAREVLSGCGELTVVPVKTAITRYAARSLHPQEACRRIREGARAAVGRVGTLRPFRPAGPHDLEVTFHHAAMADAAELVPDTTRVDAVRCAYRAADPERLLRVLIAWTILAASTVV